LRECRADSETEQTEDYTTTAGEQGVVSTESRQVESMLYTVELSK